MSSIQRIVLAVAAALGVVAGAQAAAGAAGWEEGPRWELDRGTARGVVVSDEEEGLTLSVSGRNLLQDPSFESAPEQCRQIPDAYTPSSKPTQGWEHNGLADGSGAVRAAPAHSGKGAWELVDTISPGEPALVQKVPFLPRYRGRIVVFSVWARTREGTNNEAAIAIKLNTRSHWRGDVKRPLSVGPEWKQYTLTAVVPSDADELGAVIGPSSYEGQGALIVDDAVLAVGDCVKEGVYTSPARGMGDDRSQVWRAECRPSVPPGTRVELLARTGSTPAPGRGWSPWRRVGEWGKGRMGEWATWRCTAARRHLQRHNRLPLPHSPILPFSHSPAPRGPLPPVPASPVQRAAGQDARGRERALLLGRPSGLCLRACAPRAHGRAGRGRCRHPRG